MFREIKASLRQLYLEDKRPWLVGFSGGIEFPTTEEVWAYLLQKPNPRDNRPLYNLYASASNGECPIQSRWARVNPALRA
jgi:3'-phosphoadenosine 5'-phosphosulfate sulfotransferase (PAPS reductase)/FAD synthetase